MSFSNFFAVDGYSNTFCLYVTNKNIITVKPVYKGHSREPENVPFMSSCPLYMHYSLMGKYGCPLLKVICYRDMHWKEGFVNGVVIVVDNSSYLILLRVCYTY
jgi:hypothetical protein